MKKQILMLVILIIFGTAAYSQEKSVFFPKLDRNQAVLNYFKSLDEAESYIKINTNPSDYFKTGYYYYCYSFTLYNDEKKNKNKITSLLKDGSDYLEKALEKEPDNANYSAVYGMIYLQWGLRKGFPRLIMTSSKAINYINKAVDMEPENLDIRLLRLMNFSYFPYQWYKQYKPMIQNDEKIIIKWIDDLNYLYSKDRKVKEILNEKWGFETENSILDEVYYCLGRYYYIELKDRKKGNEYFSKINENSFWLKRAEQNKKDADKVSW